MTQTPYASYAQPVQFKDGGCPDCGSTGFHPGPRGGLAHNIRCAGCGATFWYSPPFTPERIAPVEGVYDLDKRLRLEQITACSYCGAPDNGTCAYPSEAKPGCLLPASRERLRRYWFTPGFAECRPDLTVCPLCGNDPAKCPSLKARN